MNFQKGRFLRDLSTFGIGGEIRYFLEATRSQDVEEALLFAKTQQIPFFILGKGSNCLFDDRGFDGLVIQVRLDFCSWEGNRARAGAGYSFALLGVQSARQQLSGLEFASGIPASVGGALYMNAGANGGETCDVVESVEYLHADGTKRRYRKEELQWGYRTSSFQSWNGCILEGTFALKPKEEARARQLEILNYRLKTQPLKEKSAGCVFRNPAPNQPAGALIDSCGLKGASVGGAEVSSTHANFVINRGGATAQDVLTLIQQVQETVYRKTGVHLEPEIRKVGWDGTISS